MKPIPAMKIGPIGRVWARWSEWVDRKWGWQHMHPWLGVLTLEGLRTVLRRDNLHDTDELPVKAAAPTPTENPRWRTARSTDGSYNDLSSPAMGSAGARFGRNVPLGETSVSHGNVLRPNPREVSLKLMTRDEFIPATSLNLLAACWLQFMVHDWLQHGKNQSGDPWVVPLADDDPWPHRPMHISRTRHDPTRPEGVQASPSFVNTVTHWWDGSQIYGSDEATQMRVRTANEGKLRVDPNGLLPLEAGLHQDTTGVTANYWVGLSLMHTLFTLEHNAICDQLHDEYPDWSDENLFDHARLVNTALMAKIHTVEWTPGILNHPTLKIAMNANWWGLWGKWVKLNLGRLGKAALWSGIPGSPQDHFGVPFSITEDFVAVYRMHPLLPDDFDLRSVRNDQHIRECSFPEIAFQHTRVVMEQIPIIDLIYSFGTMNPGAITLHNFPRTLQRLERANGTFVDLAAVDILRTRERGVPRYNRFRELMHKKPVASFEELVSDPKDAQLIKEVYQGDLDSVDLIVGLFTEPLPKGFGFSDTAFRVFALMASRRLNSDRFFTSDYTPETYTPVGMRWVNDNGFAEVLGRHFPELGQALAGTPNPFAPWRRSH